MIFIALCENVANEESVMVHNWRRRNHSQTHYERVDPDLSTVAIGICFDLFKRASIAYSYHRGRDGNTKRNYGSYVLIDENKGVTTRAYIRAHSVVVG